MSERTYTEDQIRRSYHRYRSQNCCTEQQFVDRINREWVKDNKNEVGWGDAVSITGGPGLPGTVIGYDPYSAEILVQYVHCGKWKIDPFDPLVLVRNGRPVTGWKS